MAAREIKKDHVKQTLNSMTKELLPGILAVDVPSVKISLPTTSDLFKKHFNDYGSAGLLHPNMEAFFNDLNDVCKIEDAFKTISPPTP